MKTIIKDVSEIPIYFDVECLANILCISLTTAYKLTKEEGFPAIRFGRKIVVYKEDFLMWISQIK